MKLAILTIIILTLSACAEMGSTTTVRSPGEWNATAEAAQVLAALAVDATTAAQAARQADAAVMAMHTAAAKDATMAAVEATRAAGEAQLLALNLRGTEMAQQITQSAATSTAVYDAQLAEQRLLATEQELRQAAAQFEREETTRLIGSVVLYLLLLGAGATMLWAGGYLTYAYAQKQRRPIYSVPTGNGRTLAVVSSGWVEVPSTVAEPPLYLPAGDKQLLLPKPSVPPLPPLTDCHVMVVGATGDGKSNLLKVLTEQRRGVTVFDPHYRPGSWPEHALVISRQDALQEALLDMRSVLDGRIEQGLTDYSGSVSYQQRTIVVDELPSLAYTFGNEIWETFRRWVYEGRKYRLFLILGTTTTQVKSLRLEGQSAVFDNFRAVVYLGATAVKLDPDAVAEMDQPALLRYANKDPHPVLIPYRANLDPDSRAFRPPLASMGQDAIDATIFNRAPLSTLASRNQAALYLAGRANGRASGQEYERLDAALRYRADVLNCTWAQDLLNGRKPDADDGRL